MNKYIRTHYVEDGSKSGNAFIIANNSDHSLKGFRKLLKEARKAFPDLKEDDVECRTVVNSSWCEGGAVLRFPCPPDIVIDGWTNVEKLPNVVVF